MKYYDHIFDNKLVATDIKRLINQVFKLLPMRENAEDWQKQIKNVLRELRGLHRMFGGELDFLIIISKLEGLDESDDMMSYRSEVFSIISLMTILQNQINDRES